MFQVKNLHKSIQQKQILKDISFKLNAGEVTVVLGPSGSGKTTLMRTLAKLEPFDSGYIFLDDIPLKAVPASKIGMVFQGFSLFPHLTILENLTLAPIKAMELLKEEAVKKAMDLLEQFGLADKAAAVPGNLSGGQKQRVAMCRTLMMEPALLMMDEPTSALDPEMVKDVAEFIQTLRSKNRSMLIVSHELRLAQLCADRVFFMDEGILLDDLSKEDFFDPIHQKISKRGAKFLENYMAR
ncbi:MAG: peptide ABC transporter ATP-binding protein [Alphaproteobacteria bacterium CG_4_10_14_0_8_um_filter_37_21]|nr:MAG: peptide ABC transporter ATP-binding protein [Alphaproteobacteria bacterium CG_4_10_14_0_8_um_filter_37_21]